MEGEDENVSMRVHMSRAFRLLAERKPLRQRVKAGTSSPDDAARLDDLTDQLLESLVQELRHVAEDAAAAVRSRRGGNDG